MKLAQTQSYALLDSCSVYASEACDKCGQLPGALRFTRRGEAGEWCSRDCHGAAPREVARKSGRARKYRNLEERRAAKTRQQRDYRNADGMKKTLL